MSQGFVRHFIACNRCEMSRFAPFYIGGKLYGYVRKEIAGLLPQTGTVKPFKDGIVLAPATDDFAGRSAALAIATTFLCAHYKKPLRNEPYAVTDKWEDEPVAQIDRVAVPWFALRAWGIHVNGFVRKKGGMHLWVGKRAANRPAEPGKLDNLVGGGQPFGLSFEENLCKEAGEEAGIAPEMARTAHFVGDMHYILEWQEGMRRDTLCLYDLELPESFTPQNTDGEVASYALLPLAEVARLVRETDKFKFNCNLVIIDFLIRHGFIGPQDAEYSALQKWLK